MRFLLIGLIGLGWCLGACQPMSQPCLARDVPDYMSTPVPTVRETPAADGPMVIGCHSGRVWGVAFSPDGRWLASAGNEDDTVSVWDVQHGREAAALQGPDGLLLDVAFSPDGRWLAVSSRKEQVRVWHWPDHKLFADIPVDDTPWWLAFSPDGSRLAISTRPRLIVYDLASDAPAFNVDAGSGRFEEVGYSADGSALAVADAFDHSILILDPADGHRVSTLGPTANSNPALAWAPSGGRLATGDQDGRIYIFDAASGQLLLNWQGPADTINRLAFDPSGSEVASGAGALFQEVLQPKDTSLRLWDAGTGAQVAELATSKRSVPGVAFSPDGRWVAAGSFDGTVRVWPAR